MKKSLFTLFFPLIIAFAAKSQTMPTIQQVYDFNVNDEFQYHYVNVPPNANRVKIIGKYYSSLNDTVFYVRFNDNYSTQVNWNPTPHLDYFFNSSYDTVFFTNLDTLINAMYGELLNDSCNSSKDTLYHSTQFCGALVYEHNTCTNCCFEGQSSTAIYSKGLGQISYEFRYAANQIDNLRELFYYKKDTLVCGTLDNITESVKENAYLINVSISPNPFTTSTQITLDKTYHNISLAVYDIQGKLMLQKQYADCNQIQLNRNGLSNGMYFLKLRLDERGVETGKIVVSE